jgi:hypothetical protein
MGINQLTDDGAVIGYKPTLEYVKKSKSNVKAEDETKKSSATDYSGKVKYSETLKSFKNNLPSTALSNIDYVTQNMRLLIDKLASSFKNGNWNQYGEISSLLSAVESNNEEYINNFIKYHHDKITGSIAPELIGLIHNTEQRLQILGDVLKELYYGQSSITTEEAKEIDKAYIQKLQSYEKSGDKAKINYLALSCDSTLNRSVSMYAFSANQQAIDIADVVTSSDSSSTSSSKSHLIQNMFEEVNNEIDYRKGSYDDQQSVEIMQKTLYNYYNKRQEIIDLYDLFNENKESVFIGNRISSYSEQVNDAVANVNRTFVGNQYFLSEMAKLELEKHFLMNIYATFNYNSEN